MNPYLDSEGLEYVLQKIDDRYATKTECLTDEDLTADNIQTNEGFSTTTKSGSSLIIKDLPYSQIPSSLTIDLFPHQDLHGYAYPWVGGDGYNLLENSSSSKTENGVTFTVNWDGTVTTTGTASGTATFDIPFPSYLLGQSLIFSGCPNSGSSTTYKATIQTDSQVFATDYGTGNIAVTVPSDTENAYVRYSITNTSVSEPFKPMLCLATNNHANFAPYENICSISIDDHIILNHYGDQGELIDTEDIDISGYSNDSSIKYGGTIDIIHHRFIKRMHVVKGYHPSSLSAISIQGNYTRFWVYDPSKLRNGTTHCYCNLCRVVDQSEDPGGTLRQSMVVVDNSVYPTSFWMRLPTKLVGTTSTTILEFLNSDKFEFAYWVNAVNYNSNNVNSIELDQNYNKLISNGVINIGFYTKNNLQSELNNFTNIIELLCNNFAHVEETYSLNNYSVGNYLIYNNIFYKVTKAIAVGEYLSEGTNITQTTVANELLSIISQLSS